MLQFARLGYALICIASSMVLAAPWAAADEPLHQRIDALISAKAGQFKPAEVAE